MNIIEFIIGTEHLGVRRKEQFFFKIYNFNNVRFTETLPEALDMHD